jgi:hypothetical protein
VLLGVVIPFDTAAYHAQVDAGDTVLSLAGRLAKYGGGGTDCSPPLRAANMKYRQRKFVGCVLLSGKWQNSTNWQSIDAPRAWRVSVAASERSLGKKRTCSAARKTVVRGRVAGQSWLRRSGSDGGHFWSGLDQQGIRRQPCRVSSKTAVSYFSAAP